MPDKKRVPYYQQFTASGSVRDQRSGVEASLKSGDSTESPSVTWNVKAETLAGLKPRVGDLMSDTAGTKWQITAVGALADGIYPCLCSREAAK